MSGRFIPVAQPTLKGNEQKYIKECFDDNWIAAGGKFVKRFEEEFSEYVGAKYGIACSNGTTALHLCLVSLGIKAGDEVIVPDLTFAATANCALHGGAKPVMVDVLEGTWTIDPSKIEEKITGKTKAIIPVHLYGHPAEMDEINEIAERHSLTVIEDACPSHGSEYRGKRTGSLGYAGCFSFHASKIITTGEGGIITTDNKEFVEKATLHRDQGMKKPKFYWHPVIGYNYRLTNLQAAVGVAQLEQLPDMINQKERQTELYYSLLSKVKGITLPQTRKYVKRVLPFMAILVEDDYGMDRDKLAEKLRAKGIETRPVFYPLHTMPPYSHEGDFPVATEIARKGLQLPSSLNLTEEDIRMIVEELK